MKAIRNFITLLCAGLLMLSSCAGSKYVVEKNPARHNPVEEIAWLKEQKKLKIAHTSYLTSYRYNFYMQELDSEE